MKRILSFILVCVVTISLVGCGGGSGSEQVAIVDSEQTKYAEKEVKVTPTYKYGDSITVLNVIDVGENLDDYSYTGSQEPICVDIENPETHYIDYIYYDIKGNKVEYKPNRKFSSFSNNDNGKQKYGLKDKNGKVVLKPVYDDAYTSGKYIYTRKGKDFRIFDENLKEIFKYKVGEVLYPDHSGIRVGKHNWSYNGTYLSNGLINIMNDKYMWGYVDINGKTVIDFNYYLAFSYGKNYSNVVGKNKQGEYKWGLIDKDGNLIIDYQYDTTMYFENGIARANKDGVGYYININNEQVLNGLLFEETGSFSEGLAPVKMNGKWGYIDTNGREVFPCIFDDTEEYFYDGVTVARYKNCIVVLTYLDPSALGFTVADVDNAYAKLNQIDGGSSYWTDLRRKQANNISKENWSNKDYEDDFNYTLTYKEVQPNTWYVTGAGVWYYFENDRTTRKTGWYNEPKDGQTYYLDKNNGKMLTGWQEIDGDMYYFNEEHSSTPNWYYIPESDSWESHGKNIKAYGSMFRDETTPDGKKVDKDGKLIQ